MRNDGLGDIHERLFLLATMQEADYNLLAFATHFDPKISCYNNVSSFFYKIVKSDSYKLFEQTLKKQFDLMGVEDLSKINKNQLIQIMENYGFCFRFLDNEKVIFKLMQFYGFITSNHNIDDIHKRYNITAFRKQYLSANDIHNHFPFLCQEDISLFMKEYLFKERERTRTFIFCRFDDMTEEAKRYYLMRLSNEENLCYDLRKGKQSRTTVNIFSDCNMKNIIIQLDTKPTDPNNCQFVAVLISVAVVEQNNIVLDRKKLKKYDYTQWLDKMILPDYTEDKVAIINEVRSAFGISLTTIEELNSRHIIEFLCTPF